MKFCLNLIQKYISTEEASDNQLTLPKYNSAAKMNHFLHNFLINGDTLQCMNIHIYTSDNWLWSTNRLKLGHGELRHNTTGTRVGSGSCISFVAHFLLSSPFTKLSLCRPVTNTACFYRQLGTAVIFLERWTSFISSQFN